jgi:hypothetical protein
VNDLPPAEHYPHGMRARYVTGCRCEPCREANRAYARLRGKMNRAGEWNGLVDAAHVRAHLELLSAAGVGYKTVADVAGVAKTVLAEVRVGKKTRVRAQTEKAVLAVGPDTLTDAKLVPARPTWKLLRALMEQEDWSRAELARRLGYKVGALQINRRRVTAKTAMRVERFYRQWQSGYDAGRTKR